MQNRNAHSALISRMQQLGYQSNSGGICQAVAELAAEDFLHQKMNRFIETIDYALTHEDLNEQRKKLSAQEEKQSESKEKKNVKREYNDNQLKLLNVLALFDQFELYANRKATNEYSKESPVSPDITMHSLRKFFAPEHKDDVARNARWMHYHSYKQLKEFFESFYVILSGLSVDVVIHVEFREHKCSLCFDCKTKSWLFINANGEPIVSRKRTAELAEIIYQSDTSQPGKSKDSEVVFSAELMSTRENSAALNPIIQKLKLLPGLYWHDIDAVFPRFNSSSPSQVKACKDLLYCALGIGSEKLIVDLMKTNQIDPNLIVGKSLTLCVTAAMVNYGKYFDALHEMKMLNQIKDIEEILLIVLGHDDHRIFDKLYQWGLFSKIDDQKMLISLSGAKNKQLFYDFYRKGAIAKNSDYNVLLCAIFRKREDIIEKFCELKIVDQLSYHQRFQLVCHAASERDMVFFDKMINLPQFNGFLNKKECCIYLAQLMMYEGDVLWMNKFLSLIPEWRSEERIFLQYIIINVDSKNDDEVRRYLIAFKNNFSANGLLRVKNNKGERLIDLAFKGKKKNSFEFLAELHFDAFNKRLEKLINDPKLSHIANELQTILESIRPRNKKISYEELQKFYENENALELRVMTALCAPTNLSSLSLLAAPDNKSDVKEHKKTSPSPGKK